MWFKNALIYRLPASWKINKETLNERLRKQLSQPLEGHHEETHGWIAPIAHGDLAYQVEQQVLLCLRSEKKLLPNSVIQQAARIRAQQLEEQQGYKVGRKQMKDLKEALRDELLPKAFSIHRDTWAWIDPIDGWFVVDTTSPGKADLVIEHLVKALDSFPVAAVQLQQAPSQVMTEWLLADENPAHFTIDQEVELRSVTESRATVRFIRQSVEKTDVQPHIEAGKQCIRLALTWQDKISFVLNDTLGIKKIAALDGLQEGKGVSGINEEEQFAADFILMSGELRQLFQHLIAELGGEKPRT